MLFSIMKLNGFSPNSKYAIQYCVIQWVFSLTKLSQICNSVLCISMLFFSLPNLSKYVIQYCVIQWVFSLTKLSQICNSVLCNSIISLFSSKTINISYSILCYLILRLRFHIKYCLIILFSPKTINTLQFSAV